MDDTDEYAWKKYRDCRRGCGRPATFCYATCAPCRLGQLAERHPEVLGPGGADALAGLTERQCLPIEKLFRDAVDARDAARAALASALGAPTVERGDGGGDVVRTFGRPAPTEADDARA